VVAEDGPGPLIGVLDLQGDVREHLSALHDVGCASRRVKLPSDLAGLCGLVVPGGESTTLSMLLESTGLFDAIEARLGAGSLPVLGTCAGLILVARQVLGGRADQRSFGVLDAVVRRNGYGRQAQSFEADLDLGPGEGAVLPAVFIRAPLIVSVGPGVEVVARLDGAPVLVRQGSVVASAFHPELTPDRRVHRLFADLCGAGEDAALRTPGTPGEGAHETSTTSPEPFGAPGPPAGPTSRPEEVPSGLGRI
jgi:pyridoxal 5'-phosphate synthase pdxT subunit